MDGTDNKCKEKGVKGKQELWLYSRVYLLVLSQPYPDIAAPPHPQLPAQVLIHSVGKAVNEAHAVRPLSVMGDCTLTSLWPNRREAEEGAGQSIINEVIGKTEGSLPNDCLPGVHGQGYYSKKWNQAWLVVKYIYIYIYIYY